MGSIVNPVVADYTGQALVTLSYDDGLLNNYELALPLHEKYGIPATFNVVGQRVIIPSFWGRHMNNEQILDAYNRGIEIASHGYYHYQNEGLTSKTDEGVHYELSQSKTVLENIIGIGNVETIAFPYGEYDERIKNIAINYYNGARTSDVGIETIPPIDSYALRTAYVILNTSSFAHVKNAIDSAVASKKWCILMFHGINDDRETLYETSTDILEQVLEYIANHGRNKLLPINTKDALKLL